jgi:acyl carrier protein
MESEIQAFVERELVRGRGPTPIASDTSLLDAGVLNSLGLLRLLAYLQNTYGIVVEDEELIPEHFGSIRQICAYVTSKQSSPIVR